MSFLPHQNASSAMYIWVAWCLLCLYSIQLANGLVNQQNEHCPQGTERFRETCFFAVNEVASYYKAKQRCHQLHDGAVLAAPKDYSTQLFLKDLVHGGVYNSYWSGLRKENDQWVFSDNTTLGAFRYWAPNEPGGARDEECVLLGSSVQTRWVTTQCHWGYRFICQLDVISGCNTSSLHSHNLIPLNEGLIRVGSTVGVKCAEGRGVLSGTEHAKCALGGRWEASGRCVVGCPPPQLAPEVRLVRGRSAYLVGEKPEVVCEDNNSVVVNAGIICNANGQWLGKSPECKRRDLIPQPSIPIHTITSVNGLVVQSSVSPPVPNYKFPEEPTLYTVTSGSSLYVNCLKNDRRTPTTWIWMKEQRILQRPNTSVAHVRIHTNGTLHIARMTADAEGLYTCLAESWSTGSVQERTIYVAMPKNCNNARLQITPDVDQVTIGDYVLVRCYSPNSITKWYLNNEPIHDIDDGQSHRTLTNGALIVHKTILRQTETFKCIVENLYTHCRIETTVNILSNISNNKVDISQICGLTPGVSQATVPPYTHGKIVGGHEAVKGSHPWVVIFETTTISGQQKFLCGGNLVSQQWVLTAAHCFYWVNSTEHILSIRAKLGKHDRYESEAGEKEFGVSLIIIHPNFDANLQTFDNDLALVRLEDKTTFSPQIVPICLPQAGFIDKYYPVQYARSSGLVSGWGRLQEDGLQPRYMHQVRLPLVDIDLCRSSTDQLVTQNMFCAGYSQAVGDSCQGDSGGPYEIRSDDGRIYLAGLVSWGEGCSREGKYGFYTRIQNYHDYILRYIND